MASAPDGDHPSAGPAAAESLPPAQQQALDAFVLNLHPRRDLAQPDVTAALREHPAAPSGRSAGLLALGSLAAITAAGAATVAKLAENPTPADALAQPRASTERTVTRRAALAGGGAVVAAAAFLPAGAAAAATPATPVVALPDADQVALRRLSFGLTPELVSDVAAAGGTGPWIEQQLARSQPDPEGDLIDSWFPSRAWTAKQNRDAWQAGVASTDSAQLTKAQELVSLTRPARLLMRACYSKHQLFERMVDFWNNRFNVPMQSGGTTFSHGELDTIIRANAFGNFARLLTQVTTSSAMLCYLNANVSTKTDLNENLGRELLELHTVGKGNYTEAMVRDSAKILTGWTVPYPALKVSYDKAVHYTGKVQVMGFKHPNTNPDGRQVCSAYLTYLAGHPATATRLATQLIQYFCTDHPTAAHVNAVATAFTKSKHDIPDTLRVLFAHPDFRVIGGKVANPMEDLLAGFRVRGHAPVTPTWQFASPDTSDTLATRGPYNLFWLVASTGHAPQMWPTPDGYPMDSSRYDDAGTMLSNWYLHQSIALGYARGFTPADLPTRIGLDPAASTTIGHIVDRVALTIWGQPSDNGLLTATLALWSATDPKAVVKPGDWRWKALWEPVSIALNHPLMMLR